MLNDKYQDILTNDDRATEVAKEILGKGHIELKDFLAPDAWEKLYSEALEKKEQALMKRDGGYSVGKDRELKGTFAYDFGNSEEVFKFCERVHQAREKIEGKEPTALDPTKQRVGFPYKDARDGKKTEATPYHFDGAYINILIPFILPEDQVKSGGQITVFPNIRKKYGVFFSKFICRALRHSALVRKLWGFVVIPYTVGSAHIFFGDISFHGVDPIKSGERLVMTINSHW